MKTHLLKQPSFHKDKIFRGKVCSFSSVRFCFSSIEEEFSGSFTYEVLEFLFVGRLDVIIAWTSESFFFTARYNTLHSLKGREKIMLEDKHARNEKFLREEVSDVATSNCL